MSFRLVFGEFNLQLLMHTMVIDSFWNVFDQYWLLVCTMFHVSYCTSAFLTVYNLCDRILIVLLTFMLACIIMFYNVKSILQYSLLHMHVKPSSFFTMVPGHFKVGAPLSGTSDFSCDNKHRTHHVTHFSPLLA